MHQVGLKPGTAKSAGKLLTLLSYRGSSMVVLINCVDWFVVLGLMAL